ncbi:hypothetical protein ACFL2V_00125 [Pseudomonadota bacterium]
MDWWELGLVSRHVGHEFSPTLVHCPYCTNKGKYVRIFRSEKRGEFTEQDHTSDVWQCQSCAEDVFVQWHTEKGMVDFRIFPQSLRHGFADALPSELHEEYQHALSAYLKENWDVCVVLLKRLIDLLAMDQGIEGKNLREILAKLHKEGRLTNSVIEWADDMRCLEAGVPNQLANQKIARELLNFTRWVLDLLYLLPKAKQRYQ